LVSKREKEAERIFAETYPAIHAHFQAYRDALINRDDQGQYFWELRSCKFWDEFKRPKIVVPTIASGTEYAVDCAGYISNDKTTVCVTDRLNYVLGILNANLMWWFIRQIAASKQGGFYEFKPMYVSQLPIPDSTSKQQTLIIQLVDRILTPSAPTPTRTRRRWSGRLTNWCIGCMT
jgi:hypothetical protein